jgi:tetratricopeptide (TPR) repeat protein
VLLDQKRTKRMVQIVAVITTIAFIGLVPVVILASIGVGPFGGGDNSAEAELIAEAQSRVDDNPQDPDAWSDLASAYQLDENYPEAIAAAEQAVKLAPNDYDQVQVLVGVYIAAGQNEPALESLQTYTGRKNPDPEAFLELGSRAEQLGRTDLARLSYQRFLQLAPDDPSAPAVKERLQTLSGQSTG